MTDDPSRDSEASSIASLLQALAETPAAKVPPRLLATGTVVDTRFRIDSVLGQGGTAVVYVAHDLSLRRDVALKVGNVESADGIRRVEREAQALAKLVHPNVVTVYHVGSVDERMYIAMELVPGGSVRAWLAEPRSWREIVDLFAAAGDGLAAAHAAGFVHRDVKPDNILVGADGRPRVADFGLVAATAVPPSTAFIALTRTGAVMGTPAYMAPEQLAGEPTDARADQFALCASIWEALFGEPPFPGDNVASIAAAIVRGPVQAPKDRGGVPSRIVEALRRGLSLARAERWPSLPPLLAELRRRSRHRRTIVIAAAALTAVAAISIVAATAAPERPRVTDPRGPASGPEREASPPSTQRHTWVVPAKPPLVLISYGRVLTYAPSRVDVRELVPWALAEIRSIAPDAELTRITMDNVRRDGLADLTGRGQMPNIPAEIELRFISRASRGTCEPRLHARATELELDADDECDEPPVPVPRCTPAAIWGLLLHKHPDIPPDALARLTYYSGFGDPPSWGIHAGGYGARFDDDACY